MELTIIRHVKLLGMYDGDGDPSVPWIDQPYIYSLAFSIPIDSC
jgi:hypothetical protein